MHWLAVSAELPNLRSAGEPISNDQSVGRTASDSRNQHPLCNCTRDLEPANVVAESTSHPAASRIRGLDLKPFGLSQQSQFAIHSCQSFLMAVAVHQSRAPEQWRFELRSIGDQKFVEQH